MARRLTANPFRIRFIVTESAANTYTETDIVLPVAITAGGKAQAVEIMKAFTDLQPSDVEPGQTNGVVMQFVKDSKTTSINYDDDDLIFRRRREDHSEDASGIEQGVSMERLLVVDMTDGDGNGEILLERSVHVGVVGTGNAAAKTAQGYFLAHLVELSGDEAAIQAFVDD